MNLIDVAKQARENSYSPYSKFKVGSALLTKNGKVYTGCNVENTSFSLCYCAERTSFVKAISEGVKDFEAIAIVGDKDEVDEFCLPCGACRQFMSEFCNKDFKIYTTNGKEIKCYTLEELLPNSFKMEE